MSYLYTALTKNIAMQQHFLLNTQTASLGSVKICLRGEAFTKAVVDF